jgi:hypothetical protein
MTATFGELGRLLDRSGDLERELSRMLGGEAIQLHDDSTRTLVTLTESIVQALVREGTYPGRKRVEAELRAGGASLLSPPNLRVYKVALVSNVKR